MANILFICGTVACGLVMLFCKSNRIVFTTLAIFMLLVTFGPVVNFYFESGEVREALFEAGFRASIFLVAGLAIIGFKRTFKAKANT